MTLKEDQLTKNLLKEREDVQNEIKALSEDLNVINKLLLRLKRTRLVKSRVTIYQNISDIPVSPTAAIKRLFNKDLKKHWTPSEIRNELLKLKDEGRLESVSENLLYGIHAVLRTLTHNEYILKTDDKKPRYIRNKEDYKKITERRLKKLG